MVDSFNPFAIYPENPEALPSLTKQTNQIDCDENSEDFDDDCLDFQFKD